MTLRFASSIALVLPLSLLAACGDDSSTDDGPVAGSTTDTPASTSDQPGTTDDPGTTTDDPGTTTDEPDPDSSGEPVQEAQVRVMHLGVGAPGVDVFANGEGPVFENLEFRNSTAYATVPAGDYTFQVSVTGTSAEEAVLAPDLTLEADMAYTAVAIGDLARTDGAPPLQAIAVVDDAAGIDAANVRITVIHAAPAVGQVDIWEISGDPIALLENVDFGAVASLGDIPAGPLELGVDVDDDGTPDVTFSVDATPLAGAQVNVYANNDEAGAVALVAQLGDGTVLTIPAN